MVSTKALLEKLEHIAHSRFVEVADMQGALRLLVQDTRNEIRAAKIKSGELVEYDICVYVRETKSTIKEPVTGHRLSEHLATRKQYTSGPWNVDHIATGLVVLKAKSKQRAAFVAEQIELHCTNLHCSDKDDVKAGMPEQFVSYLRDMHNSLPLQTYEEWVAELRKGGG